MMSPLSAAYRGLCHYDRRCPRRFRSLFAHFNESLVDRGADIYVFSSRSFLKNRPARSNEFVMPMPFNASLSSKLCSVLNFGMVSLTYGRHEGRPLIEFCVVELSLCLPEICSLLRQEHEHRESVVLVRDLCYLDAVRFKIPDHVLGLCHHYCRDLLRGGGMERHRTGIAGVRTFLPSLH